MVERELADQHPAIAAAADLAGVHLGGLRRCGR
jgi:hypothetical protein